MFWNLPPCPKLGFQFINVLAKHVIWEIRARNLHSNKNVQQNIRGADESTPKSGIRICIRTFFTNRILFVFVFGLFWKAKKYLYSYSVTKTVFAHLWLRLHQWCLKRQICETLENSICSFSTPSWILFYISPQFFSADMKGFDWKQEFWQFSLTYIDNLQTIYKLAIHQFAIVVYERFLEFFAGLQINCFKSWHFLFHSSVINQ